MFEKQISKIHSLFQQISNQSKLQLDPIGLISSNVARPKVKSLIQKSSNPKYTKPVSIIKNSFTQKIKIILQNLFKAKCKDLKIPYSEKNEQAFINAFHIKNKNNQEINRLNLSDFNLGINSIPFINSLIKNQPQYLSINLSKNLINPNNIIIENTLKQLVLCNCKLGNDALDQLFQKLFKSNIQRLCLSSPQTKNRNILTRYEKLYNLIKNSSTLVTLQLSNIQINPQSKILQYCKGSTIKHIDLSDNKNVKGISSTLLSLNLSKNNIGNPFNYPIPVCQLQRLNLSYNKIPYYGFKQFLKITYFASIKELILDHVKLNGQIYSIQNFIKDSFNLNKISLVDCDLNTQSFSNITQGIKSSTSLTYADFTRNRINNKQIALNIASMLQQSNLIQVYFRYCDIKDTIGATILKNIRKNKNIQKINLKNNLLGDQTAQVLCSQLKYVKNIIQLQLQQNIIKYQDLNQIKAFLQRNKFYNIRKLDQNYKQVIKANKSLQQNENLYKIQNKILTDLQKQIDIIEDIHTDIFRKANEIKINLLKQEINELRKQQTQIQQTLFLRQTLFVPLSDHSSSIILKKKQIDPIPQMNEQENNSHQISVNLKKKQSIIDIDVENTI